MLVSSASSTVFATLSRGLMANKAVVGVAATALDDGNWTLGSGGGAVGAGDVRDEVAATRMLGSEGGGGSRGCGPVVPFGRG